MDFLHTDSSALDVSHPNILNPNVFTRHGSHTGLPLPYISHLDVSDQHVLQLVISDPAILHRNIAYKDVSQLVILTRCLEPNSEPALFQSFWLVHSYTRTFRKLTLQTRAFTPWSFRRWMYWDPMYCIWTWTFRTRLQTTMAHLSEQLKHLIQQFSLWVAMATIDPNE